MKPQIFIKAIITMGTTEDTFVPDAKLITELALSAKRQNGHPTAEYMANGTQYGHDARIKRKNASVGNFYIKRRSSYENKKTKNPNINSDCFCNNIFAILLRHERPG